jgi:4,5:9,10-diseco-3-hydroxy-5,9,17-trioxoandrosta-1(10),2-diene-4-oate hydrolase
VFTAETEKMVSVGGLRLRCRDEGAGPAVVLVHGIGASLEYWRYTVPALVDRHRVVAVDLPGCGFSERGPDLPTLEEAADLLLDLLDALEVDRASFVGNSMGGLVALETALRGPARVDRLILSNSAGLGREVSLFWRLAALPALGTGLIELNRRFALLGWPNFFFDPDGEPEIVARCRSWAARSDLTGTIVGAARQGLDLVGQRPEINRLDRLPDLQAPTLIVWGARDWVIPVWHGEQAHRLIPDSRLVVFENCGHCPQLEQPHEFNRLAREFLATPPSARLADLS